MDRSEELAQEFLKSLNPSSVLYEPDGKVCPDFLVDGRIAVEVRRLNEHVTDCEGELQGVETDQIAVIRLVQKLCSDLGPPPQSKSWFICYDFRRPLPAFRTLSQELRRALTRFLNSGLERAEFTVGRSFDVSLIPASDPHETCFLLGSASDLNTGGFVAALLEKNIRICVEEKNRKREKVRSRYPEWWLVLIDYVGYGAWQQVDVEHDWDKVLLVDPKNPLRAFELESRATNQQTL
jgi:hypothetical protein